MASALLMSTSSRPIGEERLTHPVASYLVCCTPRSGSTLLCDALAGAGLAGRPEEYFNRQSKATLQQPVWLEDWRTHEFPDVLRRVLTYGTTENGIFGSKLQWGRVDSLVNHLRRLPGNEGLSTAELFAATFPNLRYIWVTRRDKVRQAVSLFRAKQSDQWIWRSGQRLPEGKLTFNYHLVDTALRDTLYMEANWAQFFSDSGIVPYTVVYEDLVLNYEQTVRRVLDYLQIPLPTERVLAAATIKKQADMLSEQWVKQYYEIERARQVKRKLKALPSVAWSPSLRHFCTAGGLRHGFGEVMGSLRRFAPGQSDPESF